MSTKIHSLPEEPEVEIGAVCSGWVATIILYNAGFDNYITFA